MTSVCFCWQIFSYVSVGDLGRCARVCRSWKVLIQANILWSKVQSNLSLWTYGHLLTYPSALIADL